MQKYNNSVIDWEKIKQIISRILGEDFSDHKVYKMVYYLKNRWYLQSLKKNIYFIKNPDNYYSEDWLVDTTYRKLLKIHCQNYLMKDWYIGGVKALEIHMQSYAIPDEILIVNAHKQATEVVMFDKKMLCKMYRSKDKNIFRQCKKFTTSHLVSGVRFPIASLELAILESLYNPSIVQKDYIVAMIKKALKKYKTTLDYTIRQKLLTFNKHHSSINRLYKIADHVDPDLHTVLKNIIKRYSYFISE